MHRELRAVRAPGSRGDVRSFAGPAWLAFTTLAAALATLVVARWLWAVTLAGPVLYGEGAVAHAALLARDGAEYVPFTAPVFVAANYTPLYFHLASLGDPFVWGRLLSIACTLGVACAIAWRARAAGAVVAAGLATGWLGLAPVAIWGPAVKPDLLALVLTVAAVLALDVHRARRADTAWPFAAGVLIALAVAAKPTAALPALALGAWLLSARRSAAAAYASGLIVTAALTLIATPGGLAALRRHVVEHNALAWDPGQAALLAALAAFVIGVPLIGALVVRAPRTAAALIALRSAAALAAPRSPAIPRAARSAAGAYLVGALGIIALGGREGATINYLLDASAASLLVLAPVASRLAASALAPVLAVAQLAAGVVLLDPLGAVPGRSGTGAWGDPSRLAAARALPDGPILAEDAGLLVAQRREPVVDDLFLWSRLAERGAIDRAPLLEVIRGGGFVRIVSEVDLAALERAPGYERQRWPAWLAAAVLERYVPERRDGALRVYRPR